MAERERRVRFQVELDESQVKQLALRELLRMIDDADAIPVDDPDALLGFARRLAMSHETVSVPMFQRRLRVDLDQAEWLVAELVREEVISPGKGETFDVVVRPARPAGDDVWFNLDEGRTG